MNVLMIGSGKGSFQMRGKQLGAALGARVVGAPSDDDLRWADVVVLIKRAGMVWATLVHRFAKPIVWDALDFWSQPEENGLSESQARAMLAAHIRAIKPALVIGATEAMAEAAGGVYLPHHSWQGLMPTPAREVVSTVGYQGTRKYLGRWGTAVEQECARRGWTFVINPPSLSDCDLLVAFRDGEWDGWMCREWKSGVKIVNAMAAGRPIITQECAAAQELFPGCGAAHGSALDHPDHVVAAFDAWERHVWRAAHQQRCEEHATAVTLSSVAERYRQILQTVRKARAA